MKKALCLCLGLAMLMPACALAAEQANVSLDFFTEMRYDTTMEQMRDQLKEVGIKVRVSKNTIDATGFSVEGVPIKSLQATFGGNTQLQYIDIFVEPNASATYMQPGNRYEELLSAVIKRFGEPTSEERHAAALSKLWHKDALDISLIYYPDRREQRKKIGLFFDFLDPTLPRATPEPVQPLVTPDSFEWRVPQSEEQDAVLTMVMTLEEVKAQKPGKFKREDEGSLVYDTGVNLPNPMRCVYLFDKTGKLTDISATFTKPPYDPSDAIYDFDRVDSLLKQRYGAPEQDDPMHWQPNSMLYDPLDGSAWIKAVQKGVLTYQSTWTVGGVRVEHTLTQVEGKVTHTLVCTQK